MVRLIGGVFKLYYDCSFSNYTMTELTFEGNFETGHNEKFGDMLFICARGFQTLFQATLFEQKFNCISISTSTKTKTFFWSVTFKFFEGRF